MTLEQWITLIGAGALLVVAFVCVVFAVNVADRAHKATRDGREDPKSWKESK